MKKILHKPAKLAQITTLLLTLIGFSVTSYADSLAFTAAIQSETFTADNEDSVTRMAIGALGAEFEMNISHKLSAGVFGGAQTSAVSQENLSFGLGGFVNYYFKGSPLKSTFKSENSYISGLGRTAYFAGFGMEERFLKSEELDSEIRGGPFVRGGGRYIWNTDTFFSANVKYLLGGAEYSSIDITFGVGLYF